MITLASNQRGEVACVGRERRQEGQPMGAELEHGAVVQSGRSHAQGQADRRRRGRGRADLHMHTTHSDGQPTVRQLLEYVVTRASLDVIAITDHDTIAGTLEAQTLLSRLSYDLEVIVGEEVSTRDGHLVGLFLKERVSPGMSAAETVSAIHAQGGLAFAPHPFLRARQRPGKPITMVGLGTLVAGLALDAVETINATPFLDGANRRAQQFNAEACRLPVLATSDGHIPAAVGKGFTTFPGVTAEDLFAAIKSGATAAHRQSYRRGELLAYLRFSRSFSSQVGGREG